MQIKKVETYREMSELCADLFAELIQNKPNAVLGLATGSTPLGLYAALARKNKTGEIDFSGVKTFNLDEYVGLSAGDEHSYRYYMDQNLFDQINIDPANTCVPLGTAPDPEEECRRYDAAIEEAGGIDLQLLGIGPDGHIGFNEPSDVFIPETHVVRLDPSTTHANARFFASENEVPQKAITMGIRSIFRARRIILIATASKETILKEALEGPITPKNQASILQLHPDLRVYCCQE